MSRLSEELHNPADPRSCNTRITLIILILMIYAEALCKRFVETTGSANNPTRERVRLAQSVSRGAVSLVLSVGATV